MTAKELRKKYIDFFVSKKHKHISSAPLVPENDPTCLFTTAGMHPLVPFLLGEKHPAGNRLTNVQKCLRTDDIDEVGDATHNTFFEMLGNWSLGDLASPDGIGKGGYFKEDAIKMSWEFLTEVLKLDKNNIAVSCYAGNKKADIPRDEESAKIWKSLGIKDERIKYLDDNWWGPAGNTGPCGPDTEMFYWIGKNPAPKKFDPSDAKWVEIWNDVLMQYDKTKDGKYIPLKQKNIDTGMGLERTLAVIQAKDSIYETELFSPLMDYIKTKSTLFDIKGARIIADHIRASVFIITDGIEPSNLDQGYILRRLIRRVIRYANLLGINTKDYLSDLVKIIIKNYKDIYPEVNKPNHIIEVINKEAKKFEQALALGEKEFSKAVNQIKNHRQNIISGRLAFKLYESYGLPIEMIEEMAKEENMTVDKKGFNTSFEKHQLLSRKGAEKKFSGGLADHSEIVTRYHTVTHLLHQALRQVLGETVMQKGSNITSERLRFDFTYKDKLTEDEKKKVEKIVNETIKKELPVTMCEMDLKSAKASGALGFFESKYGKIVKVYTVGISDKDYFSREICGGPHVKNTRELGEFQITSEKSSSSGVRRIKAVLK